MGGVTGPEGPTAPSPFCPVGIAARVCERSGIIAGRPPASPRPGGRGGGSALPSRGGWKKGHMPVCGEGGTIQCILSSPANRYRRAADAGRNP